MKFNELSTIWSFKKQAVIGDEWTSYNFLNFNKLVDRNTDIRDSLSNYPFVYFSNQLQQEQVITMPIDSSKAFLQKTFHPKKDIGTYTIKSYKPTDIIINCDLKENGSLNIQQAYYNGWSATVDNKESIINWNTGMLMSLPMGVGKHIVEFHYNNSLFKTSLILSLLLACLLIFYYINTSSLDKKNMELFSIIWLTCLCLLVFKYFYNSKNQNQKTSNEIVLTNNQAVKHTFDFTNSSDIHNAFKFIK